MSDFLGNIFFALACVGTVGWFAVVGHVMNWWTLPKKRN